MRKGSLVRILVDYPPGIEELVRENEVEIFGCQGRYGVVVDLVHREDLFASRVRMEGHKFESYGFWFTDDMLELIADDPLEE